jgi:rRNA maturation RNase YbeY
MRSLNRKYRGRDYPTDVLAFPMASVGKQREVFLGDVVICLPIAIGQAARFGNTADQEILRLLIHGTLHLLGYDHEQSPREATRMQRKERAMVQKLSSIPRLLI